MKKQCIICNKFFNVKPSHANKRVTCSLKCASKNRSINYIGAKNNNWKGGKIENHCLFYGKAYFIYPSIVNDSRFCSRSCSASYNMAIRNGANLKKFPKRENRNHIYKNHCKKCSKPMPSGRSYCKDCSPRSGSIITYCKFCNKPFNHSKMQPRKYCSPECFHKDHMQENNNKWKGGILPLVRRIRECDKYKLLTKYILKRDKYTCKLCGQVGGQLEVDHIVPFSDILRIFIYAYQMLDIKLFKYELFKLALKYKPFWNKTNLRTLCRKCNRKRMKEEKQHWTTDKGISLTKLTT